MVTQQDVIKKFVESLDKTSLRGTSAVDEAVRACSKFTSYSDLMNHFLADRNNASSGDDFLKRYCGINLDNADTGAIIGADAGGSVVKTAESIVPESGSGKSVYPPSNSFSYKGLTVNVPDASRLNDVQKNIVAGLYTWWLKSGLDLAKETYGISFENSDISFNKINIDFDMGSYSNLYSYWDYNYSGGKVTSVNYHINSSFYNIKSTDPNGVDANGKFFLDRVIGNAFTKMLLMAKINYEFELPTLIGRGLTELSDGSDDRLKNEIIELVNDTKKLSNFSILNSRVDMGIKSTDSQDSVVGYMLLRYLAKQETDPTNIGNVNIPADALEYNGHSYYLYSGVASTWEEAKEYCESLGGHLAVINNSAENTELFNYMKSQGYNSAYFGFSDAVTEGSWQWVDGSSVTYTNWANGEPNGKKSENYGMFYKNFNNDKWNDGDFTYDVKQNTANFICEWDNEEGSIEYTPQDLEENLTAFNSILKIGKGTDKKPYDSSNELSVKIAKSEIDFIRWLGKVWGAMTRYEHDANGNVVLDSNGDPKKDTSTSKTMINAGYNTILELDAVFKSIKNVSSGKLSASEITVELTKIGNSITKIADYLKQFKSGDPKGGFLNDTISSSLGIVTNVVTCIADGASFPEVQNIVTNTIKLGEQAIKAGIDGIWKNTKFGDFLANNVGGQKVANFVKNGKVGTVTTAITCLFTAVDKFIKNSDRYAIDGVPKSTAFANSCIDAISGIVNTLSNTYLKKIIGIDADTIFQGVHTVAAAIKWSFQHGWALITGGDTSQIKFTTTDKSFTDLIGGALKDLITGTTEYEEVFNEKNKKKIYTIKGDNRITNFGSQCTINSGEGNDTIFCHEGTKSNYIDGGNDEDIIFFYGASNEVHGGYGNDSLTNYSDGKTPSSGNLIDGEDGDDIILIDDSSSSSKGKTANTIIGSSGDDIIILDNTKTDNVICYNNGDGDDIIFGYDTNDIIKINKSNYTTSATGNNINIKIGDGSITLINAKGKNLKIVKTNDDLFPVGVTTDKKQTTLTVKNEFRAGTISLDNYSTTFTKINASGLSNTQSIEISGNSSNNSLKGGKGDDLIRGYAGKDTIFGGDGNDILFGGTDNDVLKGEKGDDTLRGGDGNDTLTGGNGKDIFIYESGNDVITDYKSGEDSVKLNPNVITRSTVKGSDVVLTTSNGTLTLKSTKDKIIAFTDDNGNTTGKIFFADTSYDPLSNGLTYDSKRTVLSASDKFSGSKIDLSDYLSTAVKVDASSRSKAVNIYGNASNNSLKGSKSADYISGGNGADTLVGGNGNDKLYGDNGNDKLQGDSGNDSLYGGLGNDTLTGGKGNDWFFYEGGNDVITDYKSGEDSIKISNGKISKTSYYKKDVIFTIGSGTLTVKNAKGKNISVTDSTNKTQTYSKTLDLLYDCNFMTDELQIDDVSEVTANNYTVGQIQSISDGDIFDKATLVSDSSLEKK